MHKDTLKLKSIWIAPESITAVISHKHGEHEDAMNTISQHFVGYDIQFIRGHDDKTHLCMIAHKAIA